MPYINYNPYNTPYPYNPHMAPPPPFPPLIVSETQPWTGPQEPPKGPYGKLSNDGFLINYVGLTSDSAEVIVDNKNRYIKVNAFPWKLQCFEVDPSLGFLKEGNIWFNTTENIIKYFDGVSIQTILIPDYLTYEDIDLIWETADGSL